MRERDLDQRRMRVLDAKPVNLDGFSVTNPELGLVAMRSPYDPEPVARRARWGRRRARRQGGPRLRRHRRVHRALRVGSRSRGGGHDARRCGTGPDDGRRQCAAGRGGAPDRWHHARQTGPRRRAALACRDADGDEQDARQENAEQPGARDQPARRPTAHRGRRGQCGRLRFPGGRDDGAGAGRRAVQRGRAADRQPGGHSRVRWPSARSRRRWSCGSACAA